MADLNSFAELIRRGKEDKRLKELQEQERKKAEFSPLLTELFKTVSTAKVTEQKRANVVTKVDELEAKIISQDEVQELVSEKVSALADTSEKKLVSVVKKLQDDIANLKKQLDAKPNVASGFGGAGSGEVRILRMDDLDKTGLVDGAIMTYSAALNKIVFTIPTTNPGGTTVTDEEMPFAKRIDFITDNELYKAEAPVGSLETSPVWRIRKVTIASVDNDVSETWASGNSNYDKVWTNRLSYTYS
jgi:vacuolar-type H+-ATPase subunit I/STV1